ncbi:MAG: tyrosine--tRNA ligase [Candidatus Omnitrophota bacterium]|nr:tyrosine--tRNA ligase [Candidatus Omnitrophota bacterium]
MEIERQLELIKRGTVEIFSGPELRQRLEKSSRSGKPLVVKAGFDPTAPDIHLGHVVLLRKLRLFQDLGHSVVFLIGDFTARIGDPTGRSEKRKQLSPQEVAENAATYKKQVSKILDLGKLTVAFNSAWFEKMPVVEILKLTAHATVAQMLSRQDFKKRLSRNEDISLLEFMYPLLQGYDSVKLEADIELGGTDQIFNLLVGRDMQKDFTQEPQVVITMPLLEGTDGAQKMSKSLGNYIGINEPAREIFGKVMSISDELMLKYYELLTDEDIAEVKKMHPRDAKLKLARGLAGQFHPAAAAKEAEEEFRRVFAKKEIPEEIPEYKSDGVKTALQALIESGLVKSGNEARRLLKQGAVLFNDAKVKEENFILRQAGVLKVGAHRFLKIII